MLKEPNFLQKPITQQSIAQHLLLHRRDDQFQRINTSQVVNTQDQRVFSYDGYMKYKFDILSKKDIRVRPDDTIVGPAVTFDNQYFARLDKAYNDLLTNTNPDKKVLKQLLKEVDTAFNKLPKEERKIAEGRGFHQDLTKTARASVPNSSLFKSLIENFKTIFQSKNSKPITEPNVNPTYSPQGILKSIPNKDPSAPIQTTKPRSISEINAEWDKYQSKNDNDSSRVTFKLDTADKLYIPEVKGILKAPSNATNNSSIDSARPPQSIAEINAKWNKEVAIKNENFDEPSVLELHEKPHVEFKKSSQEVKFHKDLEITRDNFKDITNTLVKDAYLDSHGLSAVTNEPENRHDLEQGQEDTFSPTLYS